MSNYMREDSRQKRFCYCYVFYIVRQVNRLELE